MTKPRSLLKNVIGSLRVKQKPKLSLAAALGATN